MIFPGSDSHPIPGPPDARRRQPGGPSSITQLAARVQAPGPQAPILLEPQGVIPASRRHQPVVIIADGNGVTLLDFGSIAELAFAILTPAPQSSIPFDGERMIVSHKNGGPIFLVPNANRCASGFISPVAEFSVNVPTPRPKAAV